jgi:hypothetical protein
MADRPRAYHNVTMDGEAPGGLLPLMFRLAQCWPCAQKRRSLRQALFLVHVSACKKNPGLKKIGTAQAHQNWCRAGFTLSPRLFDWLDTVRPGCGGRSCRLWAGKTCAPRHGYAERTRQDCLFGIVALGLSLQDWRRCLEIPVERRLPRLEARRLLQKPGRSPRCGSICALRKRTC